MRREWFKTYAFQFKKLMLGLGWSLFSHLWPSGGSAQRLKKQVSSPPSSLMLCFAGNKLKWKAGLEINITEQRIPGKTCMTDKVINMPDGQYGQGGFFPSGESWSHWKGGAATSPGRLQTKWWHGTSSSVYSEFKVMLCCFTIRELYPCDFWVTTSGLSV